MCRGCVCSPPPPPSPITTVPCCRQQCHLDREGATLLVFDLVVKNSSDKIFQMTIDFGIALLAGGNSVIQVCVCVMLVCIRYTFVCVIQVSVCQIAVRSASACQPIGMCVLHRGGSVSDLIV